MNNVDTSSMHADGQNFNLRKVKHLSKSVENFKKNNKIKEEFE